MRPQARGRVAEHPVEPQLARFPELLDAKGQPVAAGRGLIAVGSEQAIPPRQVETEIAVGFTGYDRTMHAMHVRHDHQPSKIAVEPCRDANVAMIEHRGRVQQNLEDEHTERPQRNYHAKLDQHRKCDLNRMEACAGGYIEVEVGVMHPVHPPKRGHRMKHHVL